MNRFQQNNRVGDKNPEEPRQPLRQFNHGASQTTSSVGIERRTRVFPLWLLTIILIVAVPSFGVFIFLYLYQPDGLTETEVKRPAISSSSYAEIDVSELLDAYLEAMGGRDALQRIRSVRYEGRIDFSPSVQDFQMYLLVPDKGMLVISPGEVASKKLMLNGDTAWQVFEKPNGARELMLLEEDETRALKWSMRVHYTFREIAMEGRASQLSVREIEYLGKPCYEVSKEAGDGSNFLAVLDQETLYLLKTLETVNGGEEKDELTVLYDDYRMVSGVVEPYHSKLYRNGSLDNEVVVESIRINSGVMSSLFEIPAEIAD